MLGKAVPFTGTAGLHFEKVDFDEVIISLANKKKVRNHIGQIHAAATVLLAETATGFVVGMNLPDDKLPLMKKTEVKFIKRSVGTQTAVAKLEPHMVEEMNNSLKGDVSVPVTVRDESGEEVVIANMVWAWVPKKKS